MHILIPEVKYNGRPPARRAGRAWARLDAPMSHRALRDAVAMAKAYADRLRMGMYDVGASELEQTYGFHYHST